jgi:hypothetical protein
MRTSWSTFLKNVLSITALLLSLAALQSPLWRPNPSPLSVTARSGATVVFSYQGQLEKAIIFRKSNATLSAGGPGQIMIHAHHPGKTSMLIRYKDGDSRLYELVILPG